MSIFVYLYNNIVHFISVIDCYCLVFIFIVNYFISILNDDAVLLDLSVEVGMN